MAMDGIIIMEEIRTGTWYLVPVQVPGTVPGMVPGTWYNYRYLQIPGTLV